MTLYDDDYRARSRRAKRAAGNRCARCWRRRGEMHSHHLVRARWSPLVVLCADCHRAVHARDRASAAPLWADTVTSIVARWVVTVACAVAVLVALAAVLAGR